MLDNEIDACRDCRRGPRSNRDGWTDEEWNALWTIYPSTYPTTVMGTTFMRVIEVVPCPAHLEQLEKNYASEV